MSGMAAARKEILVIDDDDAMLQMTEKILSGAGYKVSQAGSVAEGVEAVQRRIRHLVIVDLKLKGESGFDYLERHRKIREVSDIPILVLSGVRLPEAVYQATSLGATDYVTKPIDAAILIGKVKKALKDRRFATVRIAGGKRSKLVIQAPGTILVANEVGFVLEAGVRIAEGAKVEITSPLLRSLGCDNCVFQRTNLPTRPGFPGQYLNDIAVIGLNAIQAGRIREIMKEWR
jgi:DNA-binding response OmpR family regulator